ncbi:hypothetical protein K1719_014706 [Acacia pycnantha]|nr:hypothetical protein K1719_027548 [Acacia pycnantha]KAI9114478.1 hypothetical protein K1719_014706 [Acacia pycnantha]
MSFVILTSNRLIFNIWVLNDYDSSFWSELPTIDLNEMGLDSFVIGFNILHGDSSVFASLEGLKKMMRL